jgi:hypothetical protein
MQGLFLIRKPHEMLAPQAIHDHLLLLQAHTAVHSRLQEGMAFLAEPAGKLARNPDLELHRDLAGKKDVPIREVRTRRERQLCLLEELNDPLAGDLLVRCGLPIGFFSHENPVLSSSF